MEQTAIDKAEAFKRYIGAVIKKHRKYSGYRQSWLAKDLGIAEATISRYEKGASEIKASTMAHISHILDFDLIEYIPDGLTISQKFSELVRFSGVNPGYSDVKPVSEGDIKPDTLKNIHVMEYMGNGRIIVSADINNTQAKKRPEKTDILYDFPKTEPLPPCDDDRESFEIHIGKQENRERLRILLYGYRLIKMFEDMDTPYNTTSSMSRQVLRRIIKEPSGKIDQNTYDYYWKCLYYDQ